MKKTIDPKLPIPVLGDGSTPDPSVKPDGYQDRLNRRLNELFREFDDGTVAVYDEGIYLGQADGFNFIGTAIAAVSSTTLPNGIFDITVTQGGGGSATVDTLSV